MKKKPNHGKRDDTIIKIGRNKRYRGEIATIVARGLRRIEGADLRIWKSKRGEVLIGFYTTEPGTAKDASLIYYDYHVVVVRAEKDGSVRIHTRNGGVEDN